MNPLRFRQVHLDFHTSEDIPNIGANFDKKQFQHALKVGHVDSITLFSKCHHGMSYHSTKVGTRHPGLDFELLPQQIEACREVDVKCPIYISAGLDEYAASQHPEWIAVNKDGKQLNPTAPGWKPLGFETPYLDYLVAQIQEVVENYDAADGIFLDIISDRENFSPIGLSLMEKNGVDPTDEKQVAAWKQNVLQEYYRRTTEACHIGDTNRRVFHNSGHIPKGNTDILRWNSHLELESLPTGGWGYDHFPLSAKYAATTKYDFLGMSGKFHTTWGEFGGFKRKNALRYECASMLAYGAKCSIGDQLHPDGVMNADTYELIGAAYDEVEQKEPWCAGAKAISDIAVISQEAQRGGVQHHSMKALGEEGAARMLLELHQQFDVVDLQHDLTKYKVVILPDEITLAGEFLAKIEAYVKGGGKLILTGASGFNPDKSAFALKCGLELVKKSVFDPDYIVPTAKTPTPPVRGPFVIHGGAYDVKTGPGWEIFATRRDTYFNRAWNHFCSHQHTPDSVDSKFPAIVSNGQIAYFAHHLFTSYRNYGQMLYRDLLQDVLKSLLPNPVLETNLPSVARTSLMDQPEKKRSILHLLFAVPVKRGGDESVWASQVWGVEVIEDFFPLHNVQCVVRPSRPVTQVKLVPAGTSVPFEAKDGAVSFTIPQLECHQMVELS